MSCPTPSTYADTPTEGMRRGCKPEALVGSNFCASRLFVSRVVIGYLHFVAVLCTIAGIACPIGVSLADEGGVSFWVPGTYGSLAAVPGVPGWSLAIINYYASVSAAGDVAAAREVMIGNLGRTINVNPNANFEGSGDSIWVTPSYTFVTPVFGGQFALSMMGLVGRTIGDVSGTLTASSGGLPVTRQGTIDQGRTGFGDLYPQATLKWNSGVNNWMTYLTGDIPVGMYSSTSLANLGIGHGAIDGGVGYTYLDEKSGHELSAVMGLTYNLTNPTTNYQNGLDWHLDWGASQYLSKQFSVGLVGYFYDQITADRGCAPQLCPFESRVIGVGPQATYLFPIAGMQGYLNLKAYGEFDGHARPDGWNAWVTLSFSPSEPTATSSSKPLVTKEH